MESLLKHNREKMYNTSKQFEKFIKEHVVLQGDKQQELRIKKNKNLERLKKGLAQYNQVHNTNYAYAESRVQGSMAMNTVVQSNLNDYDIDVAIVFDSLTIEDMGAYAARSLVYEALKYKMGQFKDEPELKTNCVRIKYSDGYHIDFAIYRRYKENGSSEYTYEHAGGYNWTRRDPKAITSWFQSEVKCKGIELRKIVRLSKMFCKSRTYWGNMPGGLLQSVVCNEAFDVTSDRLDEIFYNTIVAIRNRLQKSIEVYNPTAPTISLLTANNHYDRMRNWLTNLSNQIELLNVLFEDDCDQTDAYKAWYEFFNHDFWLSNQLLTTESYSSAKATMANDCINYIDTEEYIEDYVSCINDNEYNVKVQVKIEANGIHQQLLSDYLRKFPLFRNLMPKGLHIDFYAETNCPKPYEIWWKVRNVGEYAETHNQIRGQIIKNSWKHRREKSKFAGPHYVECYVIKNNECVAWTKVHVDIGDECVSRATESFQR